MDRLKTREGSLGNKKVVRPALGRGKNGLVSCENPFASGCSEKEEEWLDENPKGHPGRMSKTRV